MSSEFQNASASQAPTETEDGMSFAEMLAQQEQDEGRFSLEPGQRVQARIVAITADTIFVSTGSKVDGIVDRAEMETDGELPYQVGDTLELYVITASPQEVKLSRAMSGDGSLAALEEARAAGMPVEGRVGAQVKGGYSVEIMKRRAFCPGSQMDLRPLTDPESVLGQTYAFLITKLENHGRNIVVSRRDLLERERAAALEQILADTHEGDTREGTVSRLSTFGAFVELAPGVEGMVHLSELSWSRVERPDDAVHVGDAVTVKVLGITRGEKGVRIALSLKAAQEDPWNILHKSLTPGDVVSGRVTRLMPFGAFVEVLPGVEGLVHLYRTFVHQAGHEGGRNRLSRRCGERQNQGNRSGAATYLAQPARSRRQSLGSGPRSGARGRGHAGHGGKTRSVRIFHQPCAGHHRTTAAGGPQELSSGQNTGTPGPRRCGQCTCARNRRRAAPYFPLAPG